MDLGFSLEGFEIIYALDHDFTSIESHRKNFQGIAVNKDIVEIDFSTVPDCDVIIGGFPCQDFSVIWKRPGINGQRGDLYRHFVRAVLEKQPKIFVAENVKGLLSANKGNAILKIKRDFESLGYKLNTQVYNFVEYGVPQMRERLIIVGIRNDLKESFIPPKPTHGPNRKFRFSTVGDSLKNVEKVKLNNNKMKIQEKTRKRLELIPPGGNFNSIPKSSPYYVKGLISHVYRRLHKDKPSYTIIASGGGGTWTYHHAEPRPLTNRERARLQTFPDSFEFIGNNSEIRRQIGNAVPPEGIRPIAKNIKKILLKNPGNLKNKTRKNYDFGWIRDEEKINKTRKKLMKFEINLGLKTEIFRGIETYSPNEVKEILNDLTRKKLRKLIIEHHKFYTQYYGTDVVINPRMNMCEYNIHELYNLLK